MSRNVGNDSFIIVHGEHFVFEDLSHRAQTLQHGA